MKYISYHSSEIGLIEAISNEHKLLKVSFVDKRETAVENDLSIMAVKQLKEYFEGIRKTFDLPLLLDGTEFQKKVWSEIIKISYGKTASYKDVAISIGNEKASRAVGMANNKNEIAIIIPCHRVIGSNKSLTGYAGGLDKKKWLLEHEKVIEHNEK